EKSCGRCYERNFTISGRTACFHRPGRKYAFLHSGFRIDLSQWYFGKGSRLVRQRSRLLQQNSRSDCKNRLRVSSTYLRRKHQKENYTSINSPPSTRGR